MFWGAAAAAVGLGKVSCFCSSFVGVWVLRVCFRRKPILRGSRLYSSDRSPIALHVCCGSSFDDDSYLLGFVKLASDDYCSIEIM